MFPLCILRSSFSMKHMLAQHAKACRILALASRCGSLLVSSAVCIELVFPSSSFLTILSPACRRAACGPFQHSFPPPFPPLFVPTSACTFFVDRTPVRHTLYICGTTQFFFSPFRPAVWFVPLLSPLWYVFLYSLTPFTQPPSLDLFSWSRPRG